MKYFCLILVSSLALTSAARPAHYASDYTRYSNPRLNTAASNIQYATVPKAVVYSTAEAGSHILRHATDAHPDGSFVTDFETSNGIKRHDQGAADGSIRGSSSYISPEGIEIKTSYVADENGYHAVGDHIPKIPDYILRSLEYIRTHPYVEKDYYTGQIKHEAARRLERYKLLH